MRTSVQILQKWRLFPGSSCHRSFLWSPCRAPSTLPSSLLILSKHLPLWACFPEHSSVDRNCQKMLRSSWPAQEQILLWCLSVEWFILGSDASVIFRAENSPVPQRPLCTACTKPERDSQWRVVKMNHWVDEERLSNTSKTEWSKAWWIVVPYNWWSLMVPYNFHSYLCFFFWWFLNTESFPTI